MAPACVPSSGPDHCTSGVIRAEQHFGESTRLPSEGKLPMTPFFVGYRLSAIRFTRPRGFAGRV